MSDERIDILEKVAEATAPHRDDIVLCGGMAAFLICRAAAAKADAAMTEDVDITLERHKHRQKTLSTPDTPTIAAGLEKAGFEREVGTLAIGDGKDSEKWVQADGYFIEFLTEDHRHKVHRISGVLAQGLSYFSMSLENTFLYRLPSGRELRVVAPAAFVMHKVLTYTKRPGPSKMFKDLYYVAFLTLMVYESPEALAAELAVLNIAPAWTKTAADNIAKVVANLAAWWPKIKDNDPSGYLTQARIEDVYWRLAAAYRPKPG